MFVLTVLSLIIIIVMFFKNLMANLLLALHMSFLKSSNGLLHLNSIPPPEDVGKVSHKGGVNLIFTYLLCEF